MAQYSGYDFTSSLELKAKANEAIQRMRQSGDPRQMMAANSQQVITALFGSPEIRKAQQVEKTITNTLDSIKKNEGESEYDFQVRQQEAVRNNLAKVDPQVAMQANERIIKLRTEEQQQRKLKTTNELGDVELDLALRDAKLAKDNVLFEVLPDGTKRPIKRLSPDQEEAMIEMEAFMAANPKMAVDLGSGLDVQQLEGTYSRLTGGTKVNNSQVTKMVEGITAGKQFALGMNNTLKRLNNSELLSLNPYIQSGSTKGSQIVGTFKALENAYSAELDQSRDGYLGAEAEAALAKTKLDKVDIALQQMTDQSIDSAVLGSQIKAMAYSLAKALDPGGRLSDQDVEIAMEMLVGEGNPDSIRDLFEQRLMLTHSGIMYNLDRAMSGELGRTPAQAEAAKLEAERFYEAQEQVFDQLLILQENIAIAKQEGRLQGSITPAQQEILDQRAPEETEAPAAGNDLQSQAAAILKARRGG